MENHGIPERLRSAKLKIAMISLHNDRKYVGKAFRKAVVANISCNFSDRRGELHLNYDFDTGNENKKWNRNLCSAAGTAEYLEFRLRKPACSILLLK